MNLLAIDASTEYCSLALQRGAACWHFHEATGPAASQRILPEIQQLLVQAQLSLTELDGVVYGMGPGAFTGVRVAVGVTQGLAFANDLPVVGISALEAVAQGVWLAQQHTAVIVCLDARMGEVYHAAFVRQDNGWWMVSAPTVCPPAAVPAIESFTMPAPAACHWVGAGSGWGVYAQALNTRYANAVSQAYANTYPEARTLLTLATPRFAQGLVQASHEAAPLYVRNRVALTTSERASGQTL